MDKSSFCYRSIGIGLLSGFALYKLSKICANYNFKSNKKVLCIEIGGTSSRFAIYQVDPNKKTIKQITSLFKKSVNSPEELLEILGRRNILFY